MDLQVQAHIPESYIDSLSLRLDVYRRIAEVETQEDAMDVTDELIDRFGEPPLGKGAFGHCLLRNTASRLGITEVKQQGDSLLVYKQKFDVAEVGPLIKALGGPGAALRREPPLYQREDGRPAPPGGPGRDPFCHAGRLFPCQSVKFTISV